MSLKVLFVQVVATVSFFSTCGMATVDGSWMDGEQGRVSKRTESELCWEDIWQEVGPGTRAQFRKTGSQKRCGWQPWIGTEKL